LSAVPHRLCRVVLGMHPLDERVVAKTNRNVAGVGFPGKIAVGVLN
jgi:hypothetical protein